MTFKITTPLAGNTRIGNVSEYPPPPPGIEGLDQSWIGPNWINPCNPIPNLFSFREIKIQELMLSGPIQVLLTPVPDDRLRFQVAYEKRCAWSIETLFFFLARGTQRQFAPTYIENTFFIIIVMIIVITVNNHTTPHSHPPMPNNSLNSLPCKRFKGRFATSISSVTKRCYIVATLF